MSVKLNPIMLVLGSLAAIVGGWGLYTMMTRIGGAPPFIGIITIAILELFAVGLAIHAVKVARDGDSPFPFNLGITLIAVVAAVVQFAAAVEEGKGVLFGTVMAMAPIAAITLWVVEVRRMFRLQGRAAGTGGRRPVPVCSADTVPEEIRPGVKPPSTDPSQPFGSGAARPGEASSPAAGLPGPLGPWHPRRQGLTAVPPYSGGRHADTDP